MTDYPPSNNEFDYDVCLSFAGEQRGYVREVADELTRHGVRVFFDEYVEAELWGKDLYEHLADVYSGRSKYCIIFASEAYAAKVWTSHERKAAQERALREKAEYILPARFDHTEIPGLNKNVAYIDLSDKTPTELADLFLKKIGNDVVTPSTADLLAKRFGEEWAADLSLFARLNSQPSSQDVANALRRGSELGLISKHGIRAELEGTEVYLRIPHPDDWPSDSVIPLHLEERWIEDISVHEWTPDQSFIDAVQSIATKLRSTLHWEGEASYNPEATFNYFASLLLYGIEAIRGGKGGVINRIFQTVEDAWIITEWELIDRKHHYQILFRRFNETDWLEHVSAKVWVDENSFQLAFGIAQMLIYRGIFEGRLPPDWTPPTVWPFDISSLFDESD
jgi:TIR domain